MKRWFRGLDPIVAIGPLEQLRRMSWPARVVSVEHLSDYTLRVAFQTTPCASSTSPAC